MSVRYIIEITENDTAAKPINYLTDTIKEVMTSTAELYMSVGYMPPWIGYLAIEENKCAGTRSFKSPPENNCVEIAYFTFSEFEGRGVATRMAQALVQIAFEAVPEMTIAAQLFPEENTSNNVLSKIGFQFFAELEHPEDGEIWE
jgi:RimJ/RimL family protein N-acetyltransferase